MKKKPNIQNLVAIENMAHDLGIQQEDLTEWLNNQSAQITRDFMGRDAVKSEFKTRFASSEEYPAALIKSIKIENFHKKLSNVESQHFKYQRIRLIEKYRILISTLQEIHQNQLEVINTKNPEAEIRAAYLLFSKAINCLYMGCDNLEAGYWFAGSVIREIDETVDLAQYFLYTKDTKEGQNALKCWFRQNQTPKHSICREVIADRMASINPNVERDNHKSLVNELYQKKSKWVHPTFGTIRETAEFNPEESLEILRLNYRFSEFEVKIYELTDFFRSSIWTVFSTFTICFINDLPLPQEDLNKLRHYDNLFNNWK